MSPHTLIVAAEPLTERDRTTMTPDEQREYLADPDVTYSIECPEDRAGCKLYRECGCHADEDDEYPEVCPTKGTEHELFSFGLGAFEPNGCFIRDHDYLPDAAQDLGLQPGRYQVVSDGNEWEDFALVLVGEAAA